MIHHLFCENHNVCVTWGSYREGREGRKGGSEREVVEFAMHILLIQHTHTDKPNYRNPDYACAPKVKHSVSMHRIKTIIKKHT